MTSRLQLILRLSHIWPVGAFGSFWHVPIILWALACLQVWDPGLSYTFFAPGLGILSFFKIFFLFFSCFSGPHPQHVKVPRLEVKPELQLSACTTATATQDLSHICDLHHNSQQRRILNPLIKARDQTLHLMVPSWIHFCCTTGTLSFFFFFN